MGSVLTRLKGAVRAGSSHGTLPQKPVHPTYLNASTLRPTRIQLGDEALALSRHWIEQAHMRVGPVDAGAAMDDQNTADVLLQTGALTKWFGTQKPSPHRSLRHSNDVDGHDR